MCDKIDAEGYVLEKIVLVANHGTPPRAPNGCVVVLNHGYLRALPAWKGEAII